MEIQLVMFKEDGERKNFAVANQTTIVGRKEDCDIRIPLAEVSRQHAEITIDRHGAHLKDLGSANGTFVNNKRIKQHDLDAGDHIVIGPVVFTVQIDGTPSDIRPVKTKLRRMSNFSPEDDLTANIKPSQREDPLADSGPGDDADLEALAALNADSDIGSSIAFELDDELDLGDSKLDD